MQGLAFMLQKAYLADLVTIIGTQDLVFVRSIVNFYCLVDMRGDCFVCCFSIECYADEKDRYF